MDFTDDVFHRRILKYEKKDEEINNILLNMRNGYSLFSTGNCKDTTTNCLRIQNYSRSDLVME